MNDLVNTDIHQRVFFANLNCNSCGRGNDKGKMLNMNEMEDIEMRASQTVNCAENMKLIRKY